MAAAGGCLATVTMAVVALTFQSSTAAADSPAAVRPAGTAAPDANARTELRARTRPIRADLMTSVSFQVVDDRVRKTVHGNVVVSSAGMPRAGLPDANRRAIEAADGAPRRRQFRYVRRPLRPEALPGGLADARPRQGPRRVGHRVQEDLIEHGAIGIARRSQDRRVVRGPGPIRDGA